MFTHVPCKTYQGNCVLINPNKDCSERELFSRNGFKNPMSNLVNMIRKGDKIFHEKNPMIYEPTQLGRFTKDHYGTNMKIGNEGQFPAFIDSEKAKGAMA